MSTRTFMTRLFLAVGLGTVLISSATSPSLAQSLSNGGNYSFEPADNGSRWPTYQGYDDYAGRPRGRAENDKAVLPSVRRNRAKSHANTDTHYYEGDDNGSPWSYYPGYEPLR
jgi:hypothetical protein